MALSCKPSISPVTVAPTVLLKEKSKLSSRLARTRNILASSHTTKLAARFGRGLLLGGYLNPASHAALRVALASAAMMAGGVAMYGF